MKKRNIFIVRLSVVAIMAGFISPSIQVDTKGNQSQLEVSIFNQAEARDRGVRGRNRDIRNQRYYRDRPHRKHRHYGYYRGRAIVGFAAGLAIGSIVASSTMPTTCTTVITDDITYKVCDNIYYQPFYEDELLVYKVVASSY